MEDSVSDLEGALDDAADEVQSLDREGRRAFDRLEDGADKAENAATALEKRLRKVRDEAKDTGNQGKKSFDKMGDATDEFKSEAIQNFSEVTSSFQGDMTSAVDLVQGTLGGLASGIAGPAGLALGGAAAVFGGMAAGMIADSEKMKESISENFREMADEGISAWESTQSQMRRLTDAYDEHADQIKKISEEFGLSFETVAAAWAGSADDLAIVETAVAEANAELRKTPGVSVEAASATRDGWNSILGPLRDVNTGYDLAKEKAAQLARQQSETWGRVIDEAETASEEVDKFGNRLLTLPDGQQVVISAETGLASQNLDTFKGDLDGVAQTVVNPTVRVQVDSSDWDNWVPGMKIGNVRTANGWAGGTTWD
jgi:uncharacterized protein YukE